MPRLKIVALFPVLLFAWLLTCSLGGSVSFPEEEVTAKDDDYAKQITLASAKSLEVFAPDGWKVIAEVSGDLDEDGEDERVVVYKTPFFVGDDTDNFRRCMAVFKKQGNKWLLWHQSYNPVLPSRKFGEENDPFEGIRIDRGCIIVTHFGGNRWSYTHRYKYMDDNWLMISSTYWEANFCFWYKYDYNLLNGVAMVEKTYNADAELPACKQYEGMEGYALDFIYPVKEIPLMDEYVFEKNYSFIEPDEDNGNFFQ